MRGTPPGGDRAEGMLSSGSCLQEGLGASHKARHNEEVEAKSHGRFG